MEEVVILINGGFRMVLIVLCVSKYIDENIMVEDEARKVPVTRLFDL
jgi:hypothetical protein